MKKPPCRACGNPHGYGHRPDCLLRDVAVGKARGVKTPPLLIAIEALDRIEDASRQDPNLEPDILEKIQATAADALAELRDPATGKPWGET